MAWEASSNGKNDLEGQLRAKQEEIEMLRAALHAKERKA
jgi:hypothetical protein